MGGSTPVSRNRTFSERTKLWDPSKTLGILNTDPGYQCITCIGYAPSQRRRCRNPIRQDNKQFITATLNEIAYLSPDSPIVASKLQEIAGPALCVRFHQGQASTILMQWKAAIRQLEPHISDRRSANSVRTSKQEVVIDQRVKKLQEDLRKMQQALDDLRGVTSNTRYQGREEKQQEEDEKRRQQRERLRQSRDEQAREARKQEKDRLEKERVKKERLEKERLEKEQINEERVRQEEEARSKREQAAHNERIRQKAQKKREERQREREAKEQKDRQEWDQHWIKYQRCWAQFRASEIRDRAAIPWPVKSGASMDVKFSNVKEFFKKALPENGNKAKLMKKECMNWHPDKIHGLIPSCQLVDRMMTDMICRVVTELLNEFSPRSAEFLG